MLLIAAVIVVAASTAAGRYGPSVFGRLSPPTATWCTSALAVMAAACSVFVVGVVVATALGAIPFVARAGAWSAASLRGSAAVPLALGAVLALLLGRAAAAFAFALVGQARRSTEGRRLARLLGGDPGEVVVLESAQPMAYALTAAGGRIVVSRGLLDSLPEEEQRCVLAHERAHLVHRHLWHRTATELAAHVHPALRPLTAAVRRSTERWADEDTARELGRASTARAIARTAILTAGAPGAPGMAAAVDDVAGRISELLDPSPRTRLAPLVLAGVLSVSLVIGTATSKVLAETYFERAMAVAATSPVT